MWKMLGVSHLPKVLTAYSLYAVSGILLLCNRLIKSTSLSLSTTSSPVCRSRTIFLRKLQNISFTNGEGWKNNVSTVHIPEIRIFHPFQKVINLIFAFRFLYLIAVPIVSDMSILVVPVHGYVTHCISYILKPRAC